MSTLHIGRFYSRCGACGGNADPHEKTHDIGGRVLTKGQGCGARYTAVSSDYVGSDAAAAVREMRPDLKYEGWLRLRAVDDITCSESDLGAVPDAG